ALASRGTIFARIASCVSALLKVNSFGNNAEAESFGGTNGTAVFARASVRRRSHHHVTKLTVRCAGLGNIRLHREPICCAADSAGSELAKSLPSRRSGLAHEKVQSPLRDAHSPVRGVQVSRPDRKQHNRHPVLTLGVATIPAIGQQINQVLHSDSASGHHLAK